jgi:hypothetical protein
VADCLVALLRSFRFEPRNAQPVGKSEKEKAAYRCEAKLFLGVKEFDGEALRLSTDLDHGE